MYGLKTIPSKSCLHHAATIMADYEWLHEIIERQAGSYARGSLLGDATGVAIIRHAEWRMPREVLHPNVNLSNCT